MDLTSLVNQMLVLLVLLGVGALANKTGVIDASGSRSLSKVTLQIFQSAMILSSVMNVEPTMGGMELLSIVGASFLMYALLILLSFAVPFILRAPKQDRGTYQFATIFGNVGFIGFTIVASVLGQEAVFYASLFNIPFNILVYSVGIYLIAGRGGDYKFRFRDIINVPLISTAIAVVIFLFKIPIPTVIAEATGLLGDVVVPMAMLIIGASLGAIPLKEAFGDWRVYAFAPFCLIIPPIVVWAVLRLFITNEIILNLAVVMASLPVATNATMLCMQYDGNEALASKTVCVTTILSVVTIPLMVSLLIG